MWRQSCGAHQPSACVCYVTAKWPLPPTHTAGQHSTTYIMITRISALFWCHTDARQGEKFLQTPQSVKSRILLNNDIRSVLVCNAYLSCIIDLHPNGHLNAPVCACVRGHRTLQCKEGGEQSCQLVTLRCHSLTNVDQPYQSTFHSHVSM